MTLVAKTEPGSKSESLKEISCMVRITTIPDPTAGCQGPLQTVQENGVTYLSETKKGRRSKSV